MLVSRPLAAAATVSPVSVSQTPPNISDLNMGSDLPLKVEEEENEEEEEAEEDNDKCLISEIIKSHVI